MMRTRHLLLSLTTASLLLAGCGAEEPAPEAPTPNDQTVPEMSAPPDDGQVAVARLAPTQGNQTTGRVTFSQVDGGISILADVSGLDDGQHGFHIHETGDCSAPDASSAGGHFAPTGAAHGAPDAPAGRRHVGDLGNLIVTDGRGTYERTDTVIAFEGPRSILGKAVIVHAGTDDFTSQPSGDAGNRLACGVIEWVDGAAPADGSDAEALSEQM